MEESWWKMCGEFVVISSMVLSSSGWGIVPKMLRVWTNYGDHGELCLLFRCCWEVVSTFSTLHRHLSCFDLSNLQPHDNKVDPQIYQAGAYPGRLRWSASKGCPWVETVAPQRLVLQTFGSLTFQTQFMFHRNTTQSFRDYHKLSVVIDICFKVICLTFQTVRQQRIS